MRSCPVRKEGRLSRVSSERSPIGTAVAPVHHGEILQGMFVADGQVKRGLVSLPCDMYIVRASFAIADSAEITVSPGWKGKAKRAAELTTAALRTHSGALLGGHLEIISRVPPGQGFGSSTSDVLAAIWAVADAFSVQLPAANAAKLAVAAETASDSLMFGESSVLFAHREGEVIEDFKDHLPRVRVLGFFARPKHVEIDTLALAPMRHSQREIEIFHDLRSDLREAILKNNAQLLGHVASASAEINQQYLPIPDLQKINEIGRAAGSVGIQISHSGNIAGLLFDVGDRDVVQRIDFSEKMLGEAGFNEQWQFSAGECAAAPKRDTSLQLDRGGHGTA
jgi:uncharacterized protein involved in propanediol utilization